MTNRNADPDNTHPNKPRPRRGTGRPSPWIRVQAIKHTALIASLFLALPQPGYSDDVIEELIVTAQKREQSLQDVSVSVSAFTGAQVEAMGWDDSLNISAHTPGLVSTSNTGDSANVALFSIRGVSQLDFAEGQEAPVAVYNDGVYLSSPGASGIPIFDLQRVEILRGPQGTLYGRNATGGLIHFIGNKPTATPAASVDITLADYNQVKVIGVVNGALGERVQGRLAVFSNHHDGWVENTIGEDRRDGNTQAMRAMFNVDFNDRASLLLSAQYANIDETGGVFDARASKTDPATGLGVYCAPGDTDCGNGPNPGAGETFSLFDVADGRIDDGIGDELEGAYNYDGGVDRETSSFTATYHLALDSADLISITDYTTSDKVYGEDDDSLAQTLVTYDAGADIEQFSQEIRLSGVTEKLDWIAGAYFLQIENDFFGAFQFPAQFAYFPRFDASAETRSVAAFGQLEYSLSETLRVVAGIRFSSDDKELVHRMTECDITDFSLGAGFCPAGLITDPDIAAATAADPALDLTGFLVDGQRRKFSRKDDEPSGRLQLEWRPTRYALYYAGYNRGTKGGGFNTPTDGFALPEDVDFDQEILEAYEVGAKLSSSDSSLRLNLSAFYYDYADFQAFFFQDTTSLLINSDATFSGAEAELFITLDGGWDFSAGIAALDTEVDGPEGSGIVDQEAPLAPELTGNLLARKTWWLGGNSGGSVSAQVSANYEGEMFFNVVNSETTQGGDYWLADASVTYTSPDDNWQAGVFVKNMFDERPITYTYDISGFGNYTIRTIGAPRWVGVNAKYRF